MSTVFLRLGWLATLLVAASAATMLAAGGARPVLGTSALPLLALAGLCFLLWHWRDHVRSPVARAGIDAANGLGLFSGICAAAALASYAAARMSSGWHDDRLVAADRLLGFDWVAVYHWQIAHPALCLALRTAYGLIAKMPVLVISGLALTGHGVRLRQFLLVYAVSLGITVLIFAVLPVQSPLVHLIGRAPPYMPSTGIDQASMIAGLRDGTINRFALDGMIGVIGFPSFHAQAALIYMWGAWPMRAIRGPMVATNLMMIAATPIEGAHYLIDVIAGLGIAGATIILCRDAAVTTAWAREIMRQVRRRGRAVAATARRAARSRPRGSASPAGG